MTTSKAINPRIILASISGFGQTGPYRMRAGFDQIAQGMGGLMGVTGAAGRGPMRAGIAVADSSAGLYAAMRRSDRAAGARASGEGQWVHTSLLEAQIVDDGLPGRALSHRRRGARAGRQRPSLCRRPWASCRPPTATSTSPSAARASGALSARRSAGRRWPTTPRFAPSRTGSARRPALNVAAAARSSPAALGRMARDLLRPHGVPAARSTAWPRSLPTAGRGTSHARPAGASGPRPDQGRRPADHHDPNAGRLRHSAAPDAGEHSDAILGEAGLSADEISALRAKGVV